MKEEIKTFDFKKGLPIEFEIKDLSIIKKSPKLFVGPFKATFYQLIWVSGGQALISVDFRDITLRAGEAVIISVNQVYSMDIRSDYKGKMILFTDHFFNRSRQDGFCLYSSHIMNPIQLNRVIQFPSSYIEAVLSVFDHESQYSADHLHSEVVQHLLSALLLESERIILKDAPQDIYSKDINIARLFFNEVENHFKENRLLEFYIGRLSVYEKTLFQEVKKVTGKTPKQYIDARLILEAKRLLVYSTLSVKEIGFQLGWDEATNFNKFFKKHLGVTPLEFRKKGYNDGNLP